MERNASRGVYVCMYEYVRGTMLNVIIHRITINRFWFNVWPNKRQVICKYIDACESGIERNFSDVHMGISNRVLVLCVAI